MARDNETTGHWRKPPKPEPLENQTIRGGRQPGAPPRRDRTTPPTVGESLAEIAEAIRSLDRTAQAILEALARIEFDHFPPDGLDDESRGYGVKMRKRR